MQVSCKVSYSVLVYLERQGVQLESFFEKSDTPSEFLKDPSCWLPIDKMEQFLQEIAIYIGCDDCENYFREIGQNNFELRAWGVLDSVLKMVESPKDIFSQPDRFLSYFLSPHPEIKVVSLADQSVSIQLSKEPTALNVLAYIMGAVEGLPCYMGLPVARIDQADDNYLIVWSNDQESLFDEEEKKRRQFHPEIVHSVMQSLHDHQKSVEEKSLSSQATGSLDSDDFEKLVSREVEKRMQSIVSQQQQMDEVFFKVKNDFYKMYDYFVRAQQLVTLISSTARKASVREAMRRVDWEHVQKEFPVMVESACDSILSLKDTLHQFDVEGEDLRVEEEKIKVDLNDLINSVVERLPMGEKTLKVDKHWLLDKEIYVEPNSFSQAIQDVLKTSVSQSRKGDEVRIVTRPNGRKIEIEITDTGVGFSEDVLRDVFSGTQESDLKNTQDIIRRHRGNISISSQQGVGSTYLIEIPT